VAGILARALVVLDRLYNFPGGTRGLTEFDLASPIQPVHDLSREVELGSRGAVDGGYLRIGVTLENATAGAATIEATQNFYDLFDSITQFSEFRTRDHRLWLVEVYGTVDAVNSGNWTNVRCGRRIDPGGTNRMKQIFQADTLLNSPESGGGIPVGNVDASDRLTPLMFVPDLIQPGTLYKSAATSIDDSIARINFTLWAGPIGTTPPGLY